MKKKAILLAMVFLFLGTSAMATGLSQEVKIKTDPEQRVYVRFRLFETHNIWSHLLLDTITGRVWHVIYSLDSVGGVIPINSKSLLRGEDSAEMGRFTLYPTSNVWNFILLDQINGRVWQCQFTVSADGTSGIVFLPEVKL